MPGGWSPGVCLAAILSCSTRRAAANRICSASSCFAKLRAVAFAALRTASACLACHATSLATDSAFSSAVPAVSAAACFAASLSFSRFPASSAAFPLISDAKRLIASNFFLDSSRRPFILKTAPSTISFRA